MLSVKTNLYLLHCCWKYAHWYMWANLDRYEHVFDGYRDTIERQVHCTLC